MKLTGLSCFCFVLLVGCRNQEKQTPALAEPFAPSDYAVSFDAIPSTRAPDGSVVWNATYSSSEGTARFKIELGPTKFSKDDSSIGFGKGRFLASPNSNPNPLLNILKTVLQAKKIPRRVTRVQTLDFAFAILGTDMSEQSHGGFDMKKRGPWTALKLFIHPAKGDDEDEIYLNLNATDRKAEFTLKDPDYGDDLLRQLAKVL